MSGVNKAIIIGRLGNDPETGTLASGVSVCNFSVATSKTWKDKVTGQKQEKTEWHRITTFNKLADICSQYLKKGSKVYIEGEISTDKYKHKNHNIDMYSTKIIANTMQMLDSRGSSGDEQAAPRASSPSVDYMKQVSDNFDEDLPF